MSILIALIVFALTLLALFSGPKWPWELFSHFTLHALALAIVAGGVMAAFGAWLAAAICALATLACIWRLAALKHARRNTSLAEPPGLNIVWSNVWNRVNALERTLQYARATDADIILIAEFPRMNSKWIAGIAPDFPYVLDGGVEHKPIASRIVALSRQPFHTASVAAAPGSARKLLCMSFKLAAGPAGVLNIYAVHPAAPRNLWKIADRDALTKFALESVAAPFVLAGDFNATPWSPALRKAALCRIGSPILESTWLTRWPLLGFPIDHIFTSGEVVASRYKVGPDLGSDHRPLLARVHLDVEK